MKIFIPFNVPSSKNSKQWTGRFLVNSKTVQSYKKNTKKYWLEGKQTFLDMIKNKEKPYKVGFYFVRDSKRKFDYINPAQTIQDLMVEYGWLDDDNCDEIIPVFLGYGVENKLLAGVYISLE